MTDTAPAAAAPAGGPPPLPRPSPVSRFLGDAEATGGPFALLRLDPGPVTDEQIIGALDAQLARLAAHVECNTPQADEVRLALHAGAAQLLDPRVRAHMIARWGSTPGAAITPAPEIERRRFPRAGSAHVALEHDAVLTLGMFGGWNSRSLHRLMALSAARGLPPEELADALRGLGGGVRRVVPAPAPRGAKAAPPLTRLSTPLPAAPPGSEAPAKVSSEPLPDQVDPAERILKYVLLGGALLLVLLMTGLGVVVLVALRQAPAVIAGSGPAPSVDRSTPAVVVPVEPVRAVEPTPAPETVINVDAVVRELAASVALLPQDSGAAVGRFELAIATLAAGWPALAPDQMVASQHQVIEFIYRAVPTGVGPRAVEAVASGASILAGEAPLGAVGVPSAVWSVGMLNRLTKENDLPSGLEQLVDDRLDAALGAQRPAGDRSFEAGAVAALQAVPPDQCRATASERPPQNAAEAWRLWMVCADRAARDSAARDRVLLGGLETLLVAGPDPNNDADAFKVVRMIVSGLTWRSGDPSREWLIKWFEDERVTSSDLYAVTSALATGSSAENVDATMVVPVLASASVRAEMRDTYNRAWGLTSGPDRAEAIRMLLESAADALANDDPQRPLSEVLGSTVVLSRLNEAASWAWRGRADQSTASLADLDLDVAVPSPNARPSQGTSPSAQAARADRGWAIRYFAAKKNIQLRLDMIDRLIDESQLDSVSAEILAAEALRGSPAEVRRAASERVVRFGASPLIVNGLLEELPTMPATSVNLALLETITICRLPAPDDQNWKLAARRALVERLLQLVASEGELAAIDRQSELLARSLEGRTLENPRPPSSGGLAVAPPEAQASAAVLYRQWKSRLDPALPPPSGLPTPEEIDRRRAGRMALARGLVQEFEAQQVSGVELMAYVVGAERPSEAPRIREVLDSLTERRQRATHIFEQIRAAEAATLRLWLIRLGQGPES